MARANLSIVRRIIFDNLGLTDQISGYGNLVSNERFLSEYIDDAIAFADITTCTLLLKNKQDLLMKEVFIVNRYDPDSNPLPLDNKWFILNVEFFPDEDLDITVRGKELSWEEFNLIKNSSSGIFDSDHKRGYYAFKDGYLHVIPLKIFDGNSFVVTHVSLTHPSTLSELKSPEGFESALANLASSYLLMKRLDKPEQSQYYQQIYTTFMQQYMLPDTNITDLIDD